MFKPFPIRQPIEPMVAEAPESLTDLDIVEIRLSITPRRFPASPEMNERPLPSAYSSYCLTLRDRDLAALPYITERLVQSVLREFFKAGEK